MSTPMFECLDVRKKLEDMGDVVEKLSAQALARAPHRRARTASPRARR